METECIILSYDVAPGSEITSCNKICKPLAVYRFSGNVMTSIITLRIITFLPEKRDFKVILMSYDKYNITFVLLYY